MVNEFIRNVCRWCPGVRFRALVVDIAWVGSGRVGDVVADEDLSRRVGAGDGQRLRRILPGFPPRGRPFRIATRFADRDIGPLRDHAALRPCLGEGEPNGLIPVDSIPFMERNKPHQDGELEEEDTAESNNGFVTETLDPPNRSISLDPPSGAKILNRFPSVPAGEYGKIRVYYDSVVGEPLIGDNVLFHPRHTFTSTFTSWAETSSFLLRRILPGGIRFFPGPISRWSR